MRKSTLRGIIALVICAVLTVGVCIIGFVSRNDAGKWFKNGDLSKWHWSDKSPADNVNGNIENGESPVQLSESESNGAKFKVRALKASEYRENDIDAQSVESAYTATVTLANHNEATDDIINLSACFIIAETHGNVMDYIRFSSTRVHSGESFTISCLKAFPYPIDITATAEGVLDGMEAPTCSIRADYVIRINNIYISCGEIFLDENGAFTSDSDYRFKDVKCVSNGANLNGIYPIYGCAPASFFIKTDLRSGLDTSVGTMTEGIKDFKFAFTAANTELSDTTEWFSPNLDNCETNAVISSKSSDCLNLFYCYADNDNLSFMVKFIDFIYGQINYDISNHYISKSDYNILVNKHNNGEAIANLYVRFTGSITGITYTFSCGFIINPEGLYIAAQNPSFSTGDIIF